MAVKLLEQFEINYRTIDHVLILIIVGEMDIEKGIQPLARLFQRIENNIHHIDQTSYDTYMQLKKDILTKKNKAIEERKKGFKQAEDNLEKRGQDIQLLYYELDFYSELLTVIDELAYKRGWF